jgi:hypothetical protein
LPQLLAGGQDDGGPGAGGGGQTPTTTVELTGSGFFSPGLLVWFAAMPADTFLWFNSQKTNKKSILKKNKKGINFEEY